MTLNVMTEKTESKRPLAPELLFGCSKVGGKPAMWKAEMLAYAQHLIDTFESQATPDGVQAQMMVMSVFKGATDLIINSLHAVHQRHLSGKIISRLEIDEIFSNENGPRAMIKKCIDNLFKPDESICKFLAPVGYENLELELAQAREKAYQWEQIVFEAATIRTETGIKLMKTLSDNSKFEGEQFTEEMLKNMFIGYGEDVVVGIYQELFNLHPILYAKAMPYYTNPNENHREKYEAMALMYDEVPLGKPFFNKVIDQGRRELEAEITLVHEDPELKEVRQGMRMLLLLRGGFTGNFNNVGRSYSDVRAVLEAVMLAMYQQGSEQQKELTFLLLKEFSHVMSTNPNDLSQEVGEEYGIKPEVQKILALSLARAARISLANGNNTPVAATVCDILEHYLHHVSNGRYSVPVMMEMRDIRSPEKEGTKFLKEESVESAAQTFLSTICREKNVSVKISNSASSEHKGFLSQVAGLFAEHGLSIYTTDADSDSIEVGVILSDDERQRERQLENFEQVVASLKDKYNRRLVGQNNGQSNGGNRHEAVKAYDKATRLTVIGHQVEHNHQYVMRMIYTLYPLLGYRVKSASQLSDPHSLTFEVEWVGEGEPEFNPSDIAHICFVEEKHDLHNMAAAKDFTKQYWKSRAEGNSWEQQLCQLQKRS